MRRCGKARQPTPPTAAEVRAHGGAPCNWTRIIHCRVCTLLSRQLVDAIREIRGQAPLYAQPDPHPGAMSVYVGPGSR